MEERGYVAEALLERLRAEAIAFRLIGDPDSLPERAPEELELAVPSGQLARLPQLMARFAQDLDLRLVELYRPGRAAWRAVLAWNNEVGHPRFMAARFMVGAEEGVTPDALFACGLVDAVEKAALSEARALWLADLWQKEPQRALEQVTRRWRLECRVERRYPGAVVGANPLAAHLLQMPLLGRAVGVLLNSRLDCRIRSPLLMPFPHGIVIERGVSLGSRVTVMHQVTIGRKDPVVPREHGGNLAVIEDNVFIGAGAKVLGPVRIGRGATVGANAVVTRDVPSHCTVVGANRILGFDEPAVGARRREEEDTVVNT